MAHDPTDSLKHNRFHVVAVDKAAGILRVRGTADAHTDISCGEALVVTDEGTSTDLERLNVGDLVTLEQKDGQAREIRVVRRVWEEYSSPEW